MMGASKLRTAWAVMTGAALLLSAAVASPAFAQAPAAPAKVAATPSKAVVPALAPTPGIAPTPEGSGRALHPWQVPQNGLSAEAYFTNVQSGTNIETPFLLKFGLSGGWGLAPISKAQSGKAGHHHLLINRELPLDFKQPLPFNDQYIHFGKGQMETVLNLPPGTYTLRLLLADQQHLPYFVYSKPTVVKVTKKNANVDPQSLVKRGIQLLNLPANGQLKPPFKLQFHASGLNVAHEAQKEKDTGHFRLTLTPKGGKPVELDFADGQTETMLAPPKGEYGVKLELLDNLDPGKLLAEPASSTIQVL